MSGKNGPKKGLIEVEGVVQSILGGGCHTVLLDNGRTVNAKVSGRLRNFHIKVTSGDRVKLELSEKDLQNGRITYRLES